MTEYQIPEAPLPRFLELYAALNEDRGWWGDANSLRFAAMTALHCPGNGRDVASAIRDVAEEIKQRSGWFGELKSSLRFIVSAMLLLHGDEPTSFLEEVKRVKEMFRERKLRRGGIYETVAILVLRQRGGGEPIEPAAITRFQRIYDEMKRHHWWLTGPDDFPACSILVGEDASAAEIGEDIERIYQSLDAQGFSKGDPLQTAANLLYLAHESADVLAQRYRALADGFRARDVKIWQSDYDELAILSFLDHSPEIVVERTLQYRAALDELEPHPGRSLTFNLGAGVAFIDLVRLDPDMHTITGAKALLDLQAILAAQQAAAAAAAASAAAASSAASS